MQISRGPTQTTVGDGGHTPNLYKLLATLAFS